MPIISDSGSAWGYKKAIVVQAHHILVIIYHPLQEQQSYKELGPDYAEEETLEASKRWAILRLWQPGIQVTLQSDEVTCGCFIELH